MKKNLIALAVAGAFVAPVAMADTSNVIVYGIADVSYDQTKNGSTAGVSGVTNNKISSNSSRIGFKGAEDLGSGLKAVWQIESAVAIDGTGASTLGTRNTFAGLSSDSLGTLTLGRNDSPYYSATRGLDVFGDHIATNQSLMGLSSTTMAFDGRNADTARYDSPDFNGFRVAAAHVAGAENNVSSALNIQGRAESLSGTYTAGPFFGVLAYEKHYLAEPTAAAGAVPAIAGALTDEKAWKLGGSYKVDQFAVNAVYEKTSDNRDASGAGHKAYYLAGVFNATANDAIKLAYTKSGKRGDGNTADTGAKQWALGVDHSLSKRTTAYAMYTKLDNDAAISYALAAGVTTGSTAAAGNGADPSAFSIGLKHAF